jgi:dolichol-phosphate hexosyltransferase
LKITVLLPTLNEEKGIGKTIDSIDTNYFKKKKWELEIIVIDGDSKDKTTQIAKEKKAKVILEKRKGYGRAYKTGISKASGEIIVTGDADATYPFDKIHLYIEQLIKEKLDFITTDRFANLKHGSMSIKHYFGNFILNNCMRVLFFVNIRDSQSGMWIFKKSAMDKIQPIEHFNDGMPFSEEIKIEMFTNKKIKAKEIPSALYKREGDVKLQSFTDGIKNFKFLFLKRVRN